MRPGARLVATVGLILALAAVPGHAQEREVRAADVAALATAAIADDAALAELRQVTSVDGHPVDLEAVTEDLGDARADRLTLLAESFGGMDTDPTAGQRDGARELAATVLEGDEFREEQLPRPFKGALEWLADRVRPIGKVFEPVVDAFESLPGGRLIFGGLLGVAAGLMIWAALARRGHATVPGRDAWKLVDPELDPSAVEVQAADAEDRGDLDAAVRLRYQAGLLRLAAAERIDLRADTTASLVAEQLADPTMDQLTAAFEAIAYGGRAATTADVAAARSGWLTLHGVGASR